MKFNKSFIIIITLFLGFGIDIQAQKARKKKPMPKPVVAKADAEAKLLADKLPYTEKILAFDSIVTDKNKTLALPKHLGKVTTYSDVFHRDTPATWRAYVNEFQDYCLFSKPDSLGHMQLYDTHLIGKQWTAPQRITDFDDLFTDITCPYLSEDGTSLFFAAKGDDGLGGYDIYRSSYDTDDKKYMEPQSLGLPFNSTANDYYCITSETDSLTWLVTDRRQPEGKVCIYYCVTRQPRADYGTDDLTQKQLLALAEMQSIKDTWSLWDRKADRQQAARRLADINSHNTPETNRAEKFMVNDKVAYTSAQQFHSSASRELYAQLVGMQNNADRLSTQLSSLREQYEASSATEKRRLTPEIVKIERQVEQLETTIRQTEKRLRNNENQSLK